MAEEILLIMGRREFEYMAWAADRAAPALKARIYEVMNSIGADAGRPNPARWPSIAECLARLNDSDEIVALMAAQMIRQRQCRERLYVADALKAKVDDLIADSCLRPWFRRR